MQNTKLGLPEIYNDCTQLQDLIKRSSEEELQQQGSHRALELFHQAAIRVPAYQQFLNSVNIDHAHILTIDDLLLVPPIDKNNYLRMYKRSDLCWDGQFRQQNWTISTTSGSTGEPFYFPRQDLQDEQYAVSAELYLRENFSIDQLSTLYIVAFPMGAWIGGVFTYEAIKRVARKGYQLSIITPGINKIEVIKAVQSLGDEFDQIIIGSYAPFLKDILDDGEAAGINWSKYKMGFVFSAEAFSEEFRDYVSHKVGLTDIYKATLNHYGTVDQGTLAHETPLAVLIRRLAIRNPGLYSELFNDAEKLPTLAQYDPSMFYFECVGNELYCTSNSGFPLVRYDLKDHGGVVKKATIFKLFEKFGIDLIDEARKVGIEETIWNWPFVYVYERSDFSVSFFAFQIYPEVLKKSLLEEELQVQVTGKFTMLVRYDDTGQQVFEVNVELKSGQSTEDDELVRKISEALTERLVRENSEYRKVAEEYGIERVKPHVILWPYEEVTHFKPGGKQKWVK